MFACVRKPAYACELPMYVHAIYVAWFLCAFKNDCRLQTCYTYTEKQTSTLLPKTTTTHKTKTPKPQVLLECPRFCRSLCVGSSLNCREQHHVRNRKSKCRTFYFCLATLPSTHTRTNDTPPGRFTVFTIVRLHLLLQLK